MPQSHAIVFTIRNEVAKVMFLQACVCPHGGKYLTRCTPSRRRPPWEQTPPPGTRCTPPDQVHPLDQVHPPGAMYTHRARYTPWDQVSPPGTRYNPPPPEIRPLLQTVCILLECILVLFHFHAIFDTIFDQ